MDSGYDILMTFTYDNVDYVLYTDNTYDELGAFNIYGAKVGKEGRLEEPEDADISDVFDMMIEEYRNKVIKGEI